MDRCPRCTWELEDGWCESCGYGAGDHSDVEMSDSEMSFYVRDDLGDDLTVTEHPMMGDDISIYETDFPEGRHANRNRATSVDSDGSTLDEELDAQANQALARARIRNRHDMRILRNLEHWHDPGLHGSSSSVGYDEDDDNFPDEQYSSDDTAGSLNDFIADDQAERPALENSPHSSRSGFDAGTEAEMDSDTGYADREPGTYEPHLDGYVGHEASTADLQRESEDGPDEGLVVRRRLVEAPALDSDEDAEIIAMHTSRLHGQRNGRRSNHSMAMSSSQRNQRGYSPDYRMIRGGGRSQQAPIEIGSDSDIPMPIPRSRRSRPVVDSDPSDGSDAENKNHSTTPSTTRRLSPPPPPRPSGSTTRSVQQKRRPVSYFVQSPSPVRASMVEEENDVNGHPPPSQSRQIPGDVSHQSDASSSSFINGSRTHLTATVPSNDNARRSPHSNRRNRATVPRRTQGRISPGPNVRSRVASLASSHPIGRAPRPETPVRIYDSDEARAAAKAERKRLKRERRLRNREMTSAAS